MRKLVRNVIQRRDTCYWRVAAGPCSGSGKKKGGGGGVEEEEGEKNLSNREQNRETVEKHGDDGISSVPDHELMGSRSLNSY